METKEVAKIDFRFWLQSEFSDKCRKNSRYSLRAFARLLEMEASSVSQILAGKRAASTKVIRRICDKLSARPEVTQIFLLTQIQKTKATAQQFNQITLDSFAVIADWHHYAILELTFAEGFQSSPRWIAKKLGISATEAKVAIDRLLRLELLEVSEGTLKKTDVHLTNGPDGFTAPALKELQRQVLQKALRAIDECPAEEKDISSMTMAINPAKLPEAKRRLKNFRRELCAFLEDGPRARVYHLGLQLYPVSENSIGENNV